MSRSDRTSNTGDIDKRIRPLSNSNRLEATEYLCWASSAVGSAVAAFSGQFLYASVPICCSLLLNLVNRRRLNAVMQRQMMGAIVRVHQQLSQDIQTFGHQGQGLPESVAPKLDGSTPLIGPVPPTPSQARLSQLDDLQLVYQEIVQLQEQYTSVRDSLAGVVDYLNNSHLATKVSVLEQEIDRLYSHVRLVQQHLEQQHLETERFQAGDSNFHIQEDAISNLSSNSFNGGWVGEYDAAHPYSTATAPSFTVSRNKTRSVQSLEEASEEAPVSEAIASSIALPSFSVETPPPPQTEPQPEPQTQTVSPPEPRTEPQPEPQTQLLQTPLNETPNWECIATLTDHSDWVSDLAVSPDAQTLIGSSFDKTLQLWNLQTREAVAILAEHTSPAIAIALTPDGKYLASGSWDKTIKLWDLEKQKAVSTLTDDSENAGSVRSVAISPDGQILASGWFDQTIKLWKLKTTGKRKRPSVTFLGSYSGHSGRVDAIAFSPDSSLLVSGSADGTLKLWQLNTTGKPLQDLTRTFAETSEPVTDVVFSPDGKYFVSASRDRTLRVWDVAHQTLKSQLIGHAGAVMAVAFSPNGKTLASASTDGTIGLWDFEGDRLLEILTGEAGAMMSVAIAPQGQAIVGGSAEGIIKIWQPIDASNSKD